MRTTYFRKIILNGIFLIQYMQYVYAFELQMGDEVECTIDGIGSIKNKIV